MCQQEREQLALSGADRVTEGEGEVTVRVAQSSQGHDTPRVDLRRNRRRIDRDRIVVGHDAASDTAASRTATGTGTVVAAAAAAAVVVPVEEEDAMVAAALL